MQGNVSVGPDGSIRVKQSFYGNDKKLQNKVNSQLAQAYEKALREIGTKPINTISADFSATVRGILELDPQTKIKSLKQFKSGLQGAQLTNFNLRIESAKKLAGAPRRAMIKKLANRYNVSEDIIKEALE